LSGWPGWDPARKFRPNADTARRNGPTAMSDPAARLAEALADRYRIERELGRGGMATVYLARDLRHDRNVALKVLDAGISALVGEGRFHQEILVTVRLRHPNILPLYDSGQAGGALFYVMPVVEGESLRARMDREPQLTTDAAVRITREVAAALGYAHVQGVIHRDIKPENILLENGHALVADFGIARADLSTADTRLTQAGLALGTLLYMSPEQAAGEPDFDGRSDVYSLACVLYEMLAGQPPFTGATRDAVLVQRFTQPPPRLSARRPGMPAGLDQVLHKAMARAPADRFDTAARFAEALAAAGTPTTGGVRQAIERPVRAPPVDSHGHLDRFGDGRGARDRGSGVPRSEGAGGAGIRPATDPRRRGPQRRPA